MQWSHKFKIVNKDKLLKQQNEIREKYGLIPHKRLDAEMLIYGKNDDTMQTDQNINPYYGGMYQ